MIKLTKEQAMAWAIALKRDKSVGDGVTNIGSISGFESETDSYQNIDDIYDEFNFFIIARLLNEPIWEIDFSLWTIDSLLLSEGKEKSDLPSEDLAYLVEKYGMPYTAEELENLINEYPIGAADCFE